VDCEKKPYQKRWNPESPAKPRDASVAVFRCQICTINRCGYGVVSPLQSRIVMKRQRGWRYYLRKI
jgi:hypothetical protein